MTGPTAVTPSPHDLPANFAYHPSYDEAISYIAESDDVSALESSQDIDWPTLKNAIKAKISDILAGFPENPEPLLHPAAVRSTTNGSSDASTSTSQGAATALASRFSSAASTSRNGRTGPGFADDSSSSDESDLLEDSNSALISGPSAGGEGDDSTNGVTSTFMAAKTRPPPERYGSWGRRLSKEETAREKLMVFGMLDEFDTSPPFTIQRLCELLLSPQSFVRSGPKFLSSLSRILAMTASHADFPPVSPGTAPTVANGVGAYDRTSGMVGPPSPNNEPIFSPIPFLRRASKEAEGDEAAAHLEGSVPPLHLDKDELMEGFSSTTSDHAAPLLSGASLGMAGGGAAAAGSFSPEPVSHAPPVTHTAQQPPIDSVDHASAMPPATTSSAGSTGSMHVPLGVPTGRVDELDQVTSSGAAMQSTGTSLNEEQATDAEAKGDGRETLHRMDGSGTVHPLSSTTTVPSAGESEEEARAMKRLRSRDSEQEANEVQE
ncbi:hypothetical protein BCV69DRAFT_278297 [Microstroma glucosiphilum]|uniref:PPP4R2-domain-containing protein n=1 Tax=Pseudomicrostroma glucosiphilum TaxID=1684307 RepID=A0A316U115_9BASI|nr:hypothetical protein BCV69DRAFT_278297 [Pseudomicrostroma glucosiphilum]PWN19089.1 hypothetical protein BCV69DRAFT_278297 [Pseudomicrostroma glucosiphilum]